MSVLLVVTTGSVALPIAQGLVAPTAEAAQATSTAPSLASSQQSRPDPISAAVAARATGEPVLIESDQTDTSRTYANPDGSKTTDYYSAPIQVDQGGTWTNIDTTLVQNADGTFSPKAAVGTIDLSGGGAGDLATLSNAGHSVGIGFGSGNLPVPTISGSTATYAGVAPGLNLLVTATAAGFEFSLQLTKAPTTSTTYTIPLDLQGLTAVQDSTGAPSLVTSSGTVVARSSNGLMYGATVDSQTGLPTMEQPVPVTLSSSATGQQELQVTPDQSFFDNPAVTYPVTIDPTTTLTEEHWTMVDSKWPTDSFYDNTGISAKIGTTSSGAEKWISYFEFNTSSLHNKYINSATFKAYETGSGSCTAEEADLYDVPSGFTASTDWDNQPTLGTKISSVSAAYGYSSSCPANWLDMAATSEAKSWASSSSNSGTVALVSANEDNNDYYKAFDTNAEMSVTYTDYPATPTSLRPSGGGGFDSDTAYGNIFNQGGSTFYGSPSNNNGYSGSDIVGMAMSPDSKGYWLATGTGSFYNYGDTSAVASFTPTNPLVGISGDGASGGFYAFTAEGNVYAEAEQARGGHRPAAATTQGRGS